MSVALEQVQFGKEASYGALQAAALKVMGLDNTSRFTPRSVNSQKRYLRGNYAPAHRSIQTFTNGIINLNGDFNFDDFLYILLCGVKGGVTSTTSGAGKLWPFPFPYASNGNVESRSIEFTDGVDPYKASGCIPTQFEISGSSAENSLVQYKSTWQAQKVVSGAITGALGDRTVNYLPGMAMTLTADAIGGTVGATTLTNSLIDWKLSVSDAVALKRRANGNLYPTAVQYNWPKITLDVTLESNAATKAEMAAYLANTGRLVQLQGQGPLIGGSTYDTLTIQLAGDWIKDPSLWDMDNADTTLKMQLVARYDPGSFAEYCQISVINALATVVG